MRYQIPTIEIKELEQDDIVTLSGGKGTTGGGDGEYWNQPASTAW